jgi:hypothetical protein
MHHFQGIQSLDWMKDKTNEYNLYHVGKGWLSTSTCRTGNQPF